MNNFLQEYGLNIVAVIIVLAFIVFASVFGDTITNGVKDITADFFAKSGVTTDINGGGDVGGVGGGNSCDGVNHTDTNNDSTCDNCNTEFIVFYFEFDSGDVYYAEKGMTWGEWCDSKYNKTLAERAEDPMVIYIKIKNGKPQLLGDDGIWQPMPIYLDQYWDDEVKSENDLIIANYTYH